MGYLSYVLIILGFASVFSSMKWLLYVRRYLMLTFIDLGLLLAIIRWYQESDFLTLLCGVGLVIFAGVTIFSIVDGKKHPTHIIEVPADSYEIVALDRSSAPTIQLSYFLRYQGQIYGLAGIPPVGKPALILSARPQPDQEWILADISINHDKTPKTPKYILGRMYAFLIFVIVMLIPFFATGGADGSVPDFYFGASIGVVLGYLDYIVVKDIKGLYYRLIYYISWFLTIGGWGILFVNLILPS